VEVSVKDKGHEMTAPTIENKFKFKMLDKSRLKLPEERNCNKAAHCSGFPMGITVYEEDTQGINELYGPLFHKKNKVNSRMKNLNNLGIFLFLIFFHLIKKL